MTLEYIINSLVNGKDQYPEPIKITLSLTPGLDGMRIISMEDRWGGSYKIFDLPENEQKQIRFWMDRQAAEYMDYCNDMALGAN